jgi:TnpA family transposase
MARFNPHYGNEASIMILTHISDQYGPHYNHVIASHERQASYIADGILRHGSVLPITQHISDTLGYTDHLFAILPPLGIAYTPRIRSFSSNKLFTQFSASTYPTLKSLIGGRLYTKLMATYWDDYLRLVSSIKLGTVSAALILYKLSNYPRLNNFAKALREFGRLERTLFSLNWIQSSALRRGVDAQLLNGERTNDLNQAVAFHREGEIWDRSLQAQQYRASGLNLVSMAIVLWSGIRSISIWRGQCLISMVSRTR